MPCSAISTEHAVLRNLAVELGLTLNDFLAYDKDVKPEVFFFDGRIVSEDDFIEGWAPLAQRVVAALSAPESSPAEFARLDALSITQWLDGVPGLDATFRKIIEFAYTGEYGLEVDQQTAFNFLWLVGSDNPDDFVIFGSSDERFHTHEGNDSFPTKVAEELASEIQLEQRLVKLRKRSDGRYVLTFDCGGVSTEHTFRQRRADAALDAAARGRFRRRNLRGEGDDDPRDRVRDERQVDAGLRDPALADDPWRRGVDLL
jgi:monoamine oxidase